MRVWAEYIEMDVEKLLKKTKDREELRLAVGE